MRPGAGGGWGACADERAEAVTTGGSGESIPERALQAGEAARRRAGSPERPGRSPHRPAHVGEGERATAGAHLPLRAAGLLEGGSTHGLPADAADDHGDDELEACPQMHEADDAVGTDRIPR